MWVFKEAEFKEDTEAMERTMEYAADFQEKAHEGSDKAQEYKNVYKRKKACINIYKFNF